MMSVEIWKSINGYEEIYEISNLSRVKRVAGYDNLGRRCKERILKATNTSTNLYKHVMLCRNGVSESYQVHRLVAEAFVPNPHNLPIVNHKDENKFNNTYDNLEWCDFQYNNTYGKMKDHFKGSNHPLSKLTEQDIREIRTRRNNGELLRELASYYGVSMCQISLIANGKAWESVL